MNKKIRFNINYFFSLLYMMCVVVVAVVVFAVLAYYRVNDTKNKERSYNFSNQIFQNFLLKGPEYEEPTNGRNQAGQPRQNSSMLSTNISTKIINSWQLTSRGTTLLENVVVAQTKNHGRLSLVSCEKRRKWTHTGPKNNSRERKLAWQRILRHIGRTCKILTFKNVWTREGRIIAMLKRTRNFTSVITRIFLGCSRRTMHE